VTNPRRRLWTLAAATTLLAACPAPGEGPKAERGFRRAAPVIEALDRYREQRGSYPERLEQLVPDFLPAAALAVPGTPQERYPLEYAREEGGYVLTFRYVGPGMNHCDYRPRARWDCGGHF
jgi:hypothetical protein